MSVTLAPVARLAPPKVGMHKLWDCCRRNPVATQILMNGTTRVTYPLCAPCANTLNRHIGTERYAAELWDGPMIAPAQPVTEAAPIARRLSVQESVHVFCAVTALVDGIEDSGMASDEPTAYARRAKSWEIVLDALYTLQCPAPVIEFVRTIPARSVML